MLCLSSERKEILTIIKVFQFQLWNLYGGMCYFALCHVCLKLAKWFCMEKMKKKTNENKMLWFACILKSNLHLKFIITTLDGGNNIDAPASDCIGFDLREQLNYLWKSRSITMTNTSKIAYCVYFA